MDARHATNLARLRVMDRIGAEIGRAVTQLYGQVATDPRRGFHFPTGRPAAHLAGYTDDDLATVPDAVVDRFAGVGHPLRHVTLANGNAVLDVGCGAGTDVCLAARRVGAGGRVVGVELTEGMAATARAALADAGLTHVDIVEARAPRFHVDGPFDLVTSNGVLNLIPEKETTLAKLHALLRPGGTLALADIVLARPPAVACLADAQLWAECLVGAYTEEDYVHALHEAGFVDVDVHARRDYFRHSASAETRRTAEDLGAFAWEVTARRAEDPPREPEH